MQLFKIIIICFMNMHYFPKDNKDSVFCFILSLYIIDYQGGWYAIGKDYFELNWNKLNQCPF